MGVEERGLRGNLIWILGIKSFSCRGGQALELLRAGLESPSLEVLKTFWGCALVVTTAVLGFGDFGDIFQPFLPQVIPSPWSESQNFLVEIPEAPAGQRELGNARAAPSRSKSRKSRKRGNSAGLEPPRPRAGRW